MAAPPSRHWMVRLRTALVLIAVAGIGGFAFAAAGVYNVAASTGHWAVTDALLRFGLWRSVAVRAPAAAPVTLDDPDRVRLGAGHYHQGCAVCHGAPGRPPDPATYGMLPAPPSLHDRALTWTDGEVFFIVRHGIKYTGMPAWPAFGRDDEVWSLVAFLRAFPALDAAGYDDLTGRGRDAPEGDREPLAELIAGCAACHGDGDRPPPSRLVPRLQGQKEGVLAAALAAYADGRRQSGIMRTAAAPLSAAQRAALARHYAALPPLAPPPEADAARVAAGRALAERGAADQRIPPCLACHGETSRPDYPRLDGQSARYLAQRLRVWRDAPPQTEETVWSTVMAPIARRLDDAQIAAAAAFFAARGAPAHEAAP